MPIIPLLTNSQPLADAPKAVLDRERRPTVENRGVLQAVGQLGAAMQQPLVNPEPFTAPYEALGAVGRALAEGGSVLGALAIKRREAQTYNQVSKADVAMEGTLEEQRAFQAQHPDEPALWDEHWTKTSRPAVEAILADKALTPAAREQIQLRADLWHRTNAVKINAAGAVREFNMARENVEGQINIGVETQSRERVAEQLAIGRNAGWLHDFQEEATWLRFERVGEEKRQQAEAAAERQEFDSAAAEALRDPQAWHAANPTPWPGRETLWQRMKTMADGRQREVVTDAMASASDAIAQGKLKTPKEIDAIENQALTPGGRAALKKELVQSQLLAEELDRRTNARTNYGALWQAVTEYDGKDDKDRIKFFELYREVQRKVGDEDGGFLQQMLRSGAAGRRAELPEDQLVLQNLDGIIVDQYHPRTGLIPWERPTLVRHADGRKEEKWDEDFAAKERARDEMTIVRQLLRERVQESPELFRKHGSAKEELKRIFTAARGNTMLRGLDQIDLRPPLEVTK